MGPLEIVLIVVGILVGLGVGFGIDVVFNYVGKSSAGWTDADGIYSMRSSVFEEFGAADYYFRVKKN